MKQVVQNQGEGSVLVVDSPAPLLQPQGILVETLASVISSGTERAKVVMGEKSLIAKAKARPDLARKVIEQARRDGVRSTLDLVRDRLQAPQPLGYSACGVVREVGALASGFMPGQMVALAGAGFANHAEINYVPATLAAVVPEGVAAEAAAFATLASIALHGIRQAQLTHGETVVVSGLGLIGQLTVRLLRAYGHPVVGVDPSGVARAEVQALGVECRGPGDPTLARLHADAVLLTAATGSDEPVHAAPTWCRDRSRVVVVGDVGLHLLRAPYYDNEATLLFSRSYGPGRYDPQYEDLGHDYPIGYVRWTEGRNLGEVLRLLSEGLLQVDDLVDARFSLDEAASAYDRLAHGDRARAILLTYDRVPVAAARTPSPSGTVVRPSPPLPRVRVSLCGAGNFARKTLVPAFEATGAVDWAYVSSQTGLSAHYVAKTHRFAATASTPEEALEAEGVDAALIATRHDSHGSLALIAARRSLPAYVEKPIALHEGELVALEKEPGSSALTTGYNRRLAPAIRAIQPLVTRRAEPAVVQARVNAGRLAPGYWADSPEQGGRVLGELCHFVDLACHLLASPVVEVAAAGTGRREPQVEDTLQVLLRHADRSVTTIAYCANGSSSLSKERVEVHWDGRSAVVEDFRQWWVDEGRGMRRRGSRRQDKGHRALVAAFVEFARGAAPNPVPVHQSIHVTRVTLAVLAALTSGQAQSVPAVTW